MLHFEGAKAKASIRHLVRVVVFNGIYVTFYDSTRGVPERKARGANGNTEIRNLTIRNVIHESCDR